MYQRILLPIDLTHGDSNTRVLATAIKMAQACSAELHAITVIPPINPMVAPYLPDRVEVDAVNDAEEGLTQLIATHVPQDIKASVRVLEGTAYQEILHETKTWKADLIILASHRPGLSEYLLGSTAAKVVRHAPVSVFVVRS